MRAILLSAALLAGCGGAVCPETRGVCVAGYHGDHAALDAALQTAEASFPIDGATVQFTDSAEPYCITERKIAGCYRAEWDIAFVEPAEPLSRSALEHELRHRAQWLQDGVIDTQHTDPRWWGNNE